MSYGLDISSDFVNLVDNPEPVTVQLVREDGLTTVEIEHATRNNRRKSRSQLDTIAVGEGKLTTWGIPDIELNPSAQGREIAIDDLIRRGNTVWAVVSADLVSLGACPSYWQCVCRERT